MNQIIFADGTTFPLAETAKNPIHPMPRDRDWRRYHVEGDYEDIKACFVDGAVYYHSWQSQTGEDENGEPVYETIEQDLSEYSIAGEIVDLRDGTFMVYMGKPTEMESLLDLMETANKVIAGEISVDEYAAKVESADLVGKIGLVPGIGGISRS